MKTVLMTPYLALSKSLACCDISFTKVSIVLDLALESLLTNLLVIRQLLHHGDPYSQGYGGSDTDKPQAPKDFTEPQGCLQALEPPVYKVR